VRARRAASASSAVTRAAQRLVARPVALDLGRDGSASLLGKAR